MDKHPDYWKLKAAFLDYQIRMAYARAHAEAAEKARADAFTAAGLDPAGKYRMMDADETIEPVE